MPDNSHTGPSRTTPTGPARHQLTVDDLAVIRAAIRNATSTRDLLTTTIDALYQALLADTGRTLAALPHRQQLRPGDHALPTSQWQAIVDAITARAMQWGTAADVALELSLNLMPGQYDDPQVPVPQLDLPDYRPAEHTIVISHEATDVLDACQQHLDRLRHAYGAASDLYLDALHSWLRCLHIVLSMNLGAATAISKDGSLGLFVRTSSGLVYAVIFHPVQRRCTVAGCGQPIADDGTVPPPAATPVGMHQHQPTYPLDGPQPGTWSLHS